MLNPSLNPIAIPDQLLPVVGGVARQARLPPQMIYAPSCLENMPNWRSYSTKGVGFGSQSRLGFSHGLGDLFPSLLLSVCLSASGQPFVAASAAGAAGMPGRDFSRPWTCHGGLHV